MIAKAKTVEPTRAASTCTASRLAVALDIAVKIATGRSYVPIFDCVRLSASGDRVVLAATDLETTLTAAVTAETTAPWAICVNAKTLRKIVHQFDARARVTIFQEGTELKISDDKVWWRDGARSFAISGYAAADFPAFPAFTQPVACASIDGEALARLLAIVEIASKDATRYHICGVHFEADKAVLHAVATDGHRLAHEEVAIEGASPLDGVTLPRAAAQLIGRCAQDARNVNLASWHARGDQYVSVQFKDLTLTVRAIDAEFPPWRTIVANAQASTASYVTVDARDLAKAIKYLYPINSRRDPTVYLATAPGVLRVAGEGDDAGDDGPSTVRTDLDADTKGARKHLAVDASFVLRALGKVTGSVVIALSDAESPIVLRSIETNKEQIIMPRRATVPGFARLRRGGLNENADYAADVIK